MYMKREGDYANIPSTVMPTLCRVRDTIIFIFIQTWLSSQFKLSFMTTKEYFDQSLFQKHVSFMGNMLCRISTYIVGFCFMDAGVLASGLAYNGFDEKTQ